MSVRRYKFIVPTEHVRKPIIGTLAQRYGVMPNIHRASITESTGECVLDLEGLDSDIEHAILYVKSLGIIVEPLTIGPY